MKKTTYEKIIKKSTDMSLEQKTKLEIFIKKYPHIFFAEENGACSWGDFSRWPNKETTRNHLIMPEEVAVIDRKWHGRHTYVVCQFYGNGDKVKDLFPLVYVDELQRHEWRNGYFLIPDLRDGLPVDGWQYVASIKEEK